MSHSDEKQRVGMIAALLRDSPFRRWEEGEITASIAAGEVISDDCVVIDIDGPVSLVVGSDYVRGVKFGLFELGLLTYYDLGYYLACANISDLAAMGAQPLGLLSVVRYPGDLTDSDFSAVMTGIRDGARAYSADLIGGDTGGAERLILSATALGVTRPQKSLTRTGARPGDVLCLTGAVGTPAAALLYFTATQSADGSAGHLNQTLQNELLASWRRPEPRVDQGRLLSAKQLATACQDVSDGLRATVEELAAASGVRGVVYADRIPLEPSVLEVARLANFDPLELALSASVDFELLFTVPPGEIERCRTEFAEHSFPLHEIGVIEDGAGATLVRNGQEQELPGIAWRHQQEDAFDLLRKGLAKREA